jgi:predicted ester cyclase
MTDSTVAHQREVVATHIRGENEHNWPAVFDTFVQDDRAHYDVVPLGTSFKGVDGVRGFYQAIAAALPDLHVEVISEYDVPGCSVREVVISGTHLGEFAGIQPLGNSVRIEIAAFYTFDSSSGDSSSGKLISERIYYDQASVMQQMQRKEEPAVA